MTVSSESTITIPLSKTKLVLLSLLALLFVIVGIWLFIIASEQSPPSSLLIQIVSIITIGFFGISGIIILFKLFDTKPGLILDAEGLIDNTSASSPKSKILWQEIIGFSILKVHNQKFIVVDVQDPQKFVLNGNQVQQMLNALTLKVTDSSIQINPTVLQIKFDDLIVLLNELLHQHQAK